MTDGSRSDPPIGAATASGEERVAVDSPTGADATAATRPQWGVFALLCVAYFVTTTGEQMLSPLFPTVADDLGLSVAQGGIAFGLLTGAIAVTNLVGGAALARHTPATLMRVASLAGLAGCIVNAVATGFGTLLVGQVLLGIGAGAFFPAGLQGVGIAAGPSKRGFAMGLYGVAFSLGLTMAAVLGAVGAGVGWRTPFWIAAGLFLFSAIAATWVDLGPRVAAPARRVPLREVLSLPTAVGTVLAVLQYGAIPFLTTFAVVRWGISAASAATVLIVGRLLSIVAKIVGGASADRIGARTSARRTGLHPHRHGPRLGAPAGRAGHLCHRRHLRRHGELARAGGQRARRRALRSERHGARHVPVDPDRHRARQRARPSASSRRWPGCARRSPSRCSSR